MKEKSSLAQLMGYAKGHRFYTYTSWVLAAISAILAFFPFLYLWQIIREILRVSPNFSDTQHIIQKSWFAFGFAVLAMIFYVAALMCSHIAAFRVASNIRIKLTHHIVKLPLNFVDDFGSGHLRKIIHESSSAMETYLAHNLPDKFVAYTSVVGLVFLLLYFDWRLGLISLLAIVAAFIVLSTMINTNMKEGNKKYTDALSDMSNEAVEYVRGIAIVKTFGQTVFSLKKFTDSINRYQKWVVEYTKHYTMPMVLYTTLINSIFAFLIMAGMIFTRHGVTGDFILNFIFYLIITPLISVAASKIMYLSQNKLIVNDALTRVNSVLEKEPLSEVSSHKTISDHSVQLENVTYSYNGVKNAIDDISLEIESNQTIALVGASGSGKSTLANLISRFFDPQEGKIMIGGVDVREIPKEALMEMVSFVFQRNTLMKGTILENIRLGKPEASEEEVLAALQAAQCMDIIEKMPNGLHTVLGTEGSYLSGGEIQRIIIARAILKNAPILVLDEATAFADADNEARIQKAIHELSKNKTVIMVAHRLPTVMNSDKVFVLENGTVCESGSPKELREKNGRFQEMWNEYECSLSWKI